MTEPGTERKRRRRRRASAPQGPVPGPPTPAADPAEPRPQRADPAVARGPSKRRRTGKEKNSGAERGMRDLVGPGHSALGVDGALRGRDVNRPSEAELAEAERDVSIVRRNWRPPPEKG
jgi:hypothetical protein